MKTAKLLTPLALAAAAGSLCLLAACKHGGEAEKADAESDVVARVDVARIERKSLSEPITAYGSVIALPARVQVIAVSFETRVRHVLVAPGEVVKQGDPLVEIEPSAAAQLQMRQAMNTADAAKRDLEQTRSRFAMKLATNQELGTAEKTAKDGALQLESLKQSGLGTDNRIKAEMEGVVAKVDVQNGQIVPSGGAQVETVTADDIEAKLGVEAEDLAELKEGTPVDISPVQGGNVVHGQVRLLTHRTNTDTRLVDVYVSLPQGSKLLLDSYVKGVFNRVAADALVVPAAAVAADDDGYCVFTMDETKAVRHAVEPGLQSNSEIALTGSGLREGQTVITTGNHELKDGDKVEPAGKAGEQ